jgi:hypothetical protein
VAFGEDLRRKLVRFAAASSDPVVLVALWSSPQMESFVGRILESAASLPGNRLTSVVVTEGDEECRNVAEETGATVCRISTRHFLEGLATLQTIRRAGADNVTRLPGLDGVQKEVASSDLAWLEEDLEIVHLAAGLRLPADVDLGRDFPQNHWFFVSGNPALSKGPRRSAKCAAKSSNGRSGCSVRLFAGGYKEVLVSDFAERSVL